eukprot:5422007-Pyramimonas_sp.AAC.1
MDVRSEDLKSWDALGVPGRQVLSWLRAATSSASSMSSANRTILCTRMPRMKDAAGWVLSSRP